MIEIYNNDGTLTISQHNRPYVAGGRPSAGLVRYNTDAGCVEAYDGLTWIPLNSHVTVDLDHRVRELLGWVSQYRQEQEDLDRLCREYPNLAEARREFEILRRLVQDVDREAK